MLHCLRTLSKFLSNLIMYVQQLKGYCHNYDWLCHLATFFATTISSYSVHSSICKCTYTIYKHIAYLIVGTVLPLHNYVPHAKVFGNYGIWLYGYTVQEYTYVAP